MNYKIAPAFLLITFSLLSANLVSPKLRTIEPKLEVKEVSLNAESSSQIIYNNLNSNKFDLPNFESFNEALRGFNKLKAKGVVKKNILTLIDFSMSSNSKRLWVIDLDSNTILFNSLVAHGRNTGEEYANSFSNSAESFKSSLGFYVTGEIYMGKHGKSLRLDGLEKGINSNARGRSVVVHGADYVSNSFIKNNKRLGRSLGCPAIPQEITAEVINVIKDKSCLFIYHPSKSYREASQIL